MLQLSIDSTFNNSCVLNIEDTTGFIGDVETGFVAEENTTLNADSFKISEGYFINFLVYKSYNCDPYVIKEEKFSYNTDDIESTYSENEFSHTYNISKDGRYTFYRFFVISKIFYLSKPSSFFTGKTVIYYDGSGLYVIINGLATAIKTIDLLDYLEIDFTGSYIDYNFLSLCEIKKMNLSLEVVLLKSCILTCPERVDSKLIFGRDYFYMLYNVILYLLSLNREADIQKLIDSSACYLETFKSLVDGTRGNCGCK